MVADLTIELSGVERVDEVRELWLALHHHHLAIVDSVALVEDDELSWRRRRDLYVERLASGGGFLALARAGDEVVAYALVCLEQGPDDTFALGDRYAELYSLSVGPQMRGQGIGSLLLDFVDRELGSRGVADLQVAVMIENSAARRFYERRGLRAAQVVMYRLGEGRDVRRQPAG